MMDIQVGLPWSSNSVQILQLKAASIHRELIALSRSSVHLFGGRLMPRFPHYAVSIPSTSGANTQPSDS